MTEVTTSSLMLVASMIAGMIVIGSGFFIFSNFMGDVVEQRQAQEFINFQAQISRVCQEIELNPNNLFTGEEFTLIVYENYKLWYEKTPSYDVERVCKAARCVCFSRTNTRVPSDCFSLDRMECPDDKDIIQIGYLGEQSLYFPQNAGAPTCKYLTRLSWDKTRIFLKVLEQDSLEEDIYRCGPYPIA